MFDEFTQEKSLKKKLIAGKISMQEYEKTINKLDRKYEY